MKEYVLRVLEQILLYLVEMTVVDQSVDLQPMEDHPSTDIHTAACGGHDTTDQYAVKEAAAHEEEPTVEQAVWWELRSAGDPHWSSLFLQDCSPWKGPVVELFLNCRLLEVHTGTVREGLYPMGGTSRWSRGRACRGRSNKESVMV